MRIRNRLRVKIRAWLGISDPVKEYDNYWTATQLHLEFSQHIRDLRDQITAISTRLVALENQAAFIKLPVDTRMQQLHASLRILTSFANELQREIDKV